MSRAKSLLFVSLLTVACSSSKTDSTAKPEVDASTDAGTGCGKTTALGLMNCVERASLESDMQTVAQPRQPGTPQHDSVRDLCKQRFEQHGFSVELQSYGTGVNVIGVRTGSEKPDERVLISAHYDAVPDCPGADDNASGVVSVLELARVLDGTSFARTLVLACWDQEEDGLVGSKAYAARAKAQAENIVVMYSLEMLGFESTAPNSQKTPTGLNLLFPTQYAELQKAGFVGDFLALIPDTSAKTAGERVAAHASEIGLKTVTLEITAALKSNPLASDVRRSDHAAFWDQDFPAMMLTDTSEFRNPNYHCYSGTHDTVDTLDMEFLAENTRVVVGSAADLLELH